MDSYSSYEAEAMAMFNNQNLSGKPDTQAIKNSDTSKPAEWPELQELVSRFNPMPYPIDALPETIRAAVVEVQSISMAPLPMVAQGALSSLAIAVQGLSLIHISKG